MIVPAALLLAALLVAVPAAAQPVPEGTPDPAFATGTGFDNAVRAIEVQGDGRILVAGTFTTYDGEPVGRVARLHPDGSLDTTFNPGGSGANAIVNEFAIQPDGKLLIAGNFTAYNGQTLGSIARLNPDGTLDTAFGAGGSGAVGQILDITLGTDGKIVISGLFSAYDGTPIGRIARLHPDGSLDTTFNPGGTGADDTVHTGVLRPDGKILIGGGFSSYNGEAVGAIARLHPDGSLDTSFELDGTGPSGSVFTIAVQPDGRIILGGNFNVAGGASANVARLHPDGGLDTSFDTGTGAGAGVLDLAVQSDGRIVITGNLTSYNGTPVGRIARVEPDGRLDTSFNTGGSGASVTVWTSALQPDGRLVIGGAFTTYNGSGHGRIARLDADLVAGPTPGPQLIPTPARLLDTRPGGHTIDGVAAGQGTVDAGGTVHLPVAGRAGIPADAGAVVLNITATEPSGYGYTTAYPCGVPQPLASNLNYAAGQTVPNLAIVRLGSDGAVCLFAATSPVHLVADVIAYFAAGTYTGVDPARLLDTRPVGATVDGAHVGGGPLPADGTYRLYVAGRAAVPGDAPGVFLNVTATEAEGFGYTTVWSCSRPRPLASNLNYGPGDTNPNLVFVELDPGDDVCLHTATAPVDLVVDVAGHLPAGSDLSGVQPARLLDTRPTGETVDGAETGIGARAGDTTYQLQVAGRGGVPHGARSVFLNVTPTEGTGPGYVTAIACDQPVPVASNVNYDAGTTRPNLVLAGLDPQGRVCLFNATSDVHLVVDVTGYSAE